MDECSKETGAELMGRDAENPSRRQYLGKDHGSSVSVMEARHGHAGSAAIRAGLDACGFARPKDRAEH